LENITWVKDGHRLVVESVLLRYAFSPVVYFATLSVSDDILVQSCLRRQFRYAQYLPRHGLLATGAAVKTL
jgi:hypothetical protein